MNRTNLAKLLLLVVVAACSKSKTEPKGSPDWGDDPRPLGACVGTFKAGVALPEGAPASYCLEKQTEGECTKPSANSDYVYSEHMTCASQGFALTCTGGRYPGSARFKACPVGTSDAAAPAAAPAAAATPPSPELAAATEAIALYRAATAAGDETADCTAFGTKIVPLREQLWELGKAHPGAFKALSNDELHGLGAAAASEALTKHLLRCKADAHAKEFAFAMGKLL